MATAYKGRQGVWSRMVHGNLNDTDTYTKKKKKYTHTKKKPTKFSSKVFLKQGRNLHIFPKKFLDQILTKNCPYCIIILF